MNESETRAEYIDPMLKASGWGEVDAIRSLFFGFQRNLYMR
ncbi:MAG: hypothetical protein WAP52_04325 [Candidatus Sungiibacteriota bacterium]